MSFRLRNALMILSVIGIMIPQAARAEELNLSGYQRPDGAIVTGFNQNTVDPYFATLSLLIAKDGGLSVRKPAKEWIEWALEKQQPNGLFNRYVLNANSEWDILSATDADDAMLALWIELLYRMAPGDGLPDRWDASISKAEDQLDALYNPEQGIYYISPTLSVGLLMDNVEICMAFKKIAIEQRRIGDIPSAKDYEKKAELLAQNIHKVFGSENDGEYQISTQGKNGSDFYPDRVGQVYPILEILPSDTAKQKYEQWMHANGKEWLLQRKDDYPWGLVAIMALDFHDNYSASCWQNRAEPMRYSKHWNVVEEMALQEVKWQLNVRGDTSIACVGGDLT